MTVTVKRMAMSSYEVDVYSTATEFDVDGGTLYVSTPESTVAVYAEGYWSSAVVS